MTYAYHIYGAEGHVLDLSTIGWLFADEFQQAANTTLTYTYPGMAGTALKVLKTGVNGREVNATITQGVSGTAATVTITTGGSAGYFTVVVDDSNAPTYGIMAKNGNNGLVISDTQYGLAYLGNAVDTGVNKPDSYGGALQLPGEMDTFRIFNITSVYKPLAFIPLAASGFRSVTSIRNIGGNTWEIVVGLNGSTVPVVKCFARMAGSGGPGYGIRLFDAAGNRTWDSTERMLVCKQKIDFPAQFQVGTGQLVQSAALTGFANPYIMIERSDDAGFTGASNGNGTYKIRAYIDGWYGSATQLNRSAKGILAHAYNEDISINQCDLYPVRVYVIEGNNYL